MRAIVPLCILPHILQSPPSNDFLPLTTLSLRIRRYCYLIREKSQVSYYCEAEGRELKTKHFFLLDY